LPFFFIASFDADGLAPPRPHDRDDFAVKLTDADPALLATARRWSGADGTAVKKPAAIEKIERVPGFRLRCSDGILFNNAYPA
jgi:hypothetical protein